MNKEEKTIISFKNSIGFRVAPDSDITTGKVIVNDIEITSVEDWEKVTKSLIELQQENEKLNHYKLLYQKVKERNDKAIEYINKNKRIYDVDGTKEKMLDEFDILASPKILIEILKGNNEE